MKRLAVILVILAAAASVSADRRFVASDIAGVGIKHPGKIVITNDSKSITAFQFHGDIRRALVSLKSTRSLRYTPFGDAVYNSAARLSTPVPPQYAKYFNEAAKAHGIDPRLLTLVARRESAFNPQAVSRVGAQGVMQLMPDTARFLGVANAFDARQNIFGGARYLKMLLQTFRGDLDLTLAAYNAGPGAVEKYRGVPPYRETLAYVADIRHAYEKIVEN
ncbi:MAG TPA: lytic transglycosylase domain-containing protein [Thermoanaerobaculia bacterium]